MSDRRRSGNPLPLSRPFFSVHTGQYRLILSDSQGPMLPKTKPDSGVIGEGDLVVRLPILPTTEKGRLLSSRCFFSEFCISSKNTSLHVYIYIIYWYLSPSTNHTPSAVHTPPLLV